MKKKVTCKPSEWEQTYLQVAKMTLGKEYEVLQEDANSYQIMHDNGLLSWMYKYNFDVVEPKTPCPPDWKPADGYIVSDYEAECIDKNDDCTITVGEIYKIKSCTKNRICVIKDNGKEEFCYHHRFATPTLRAGAKPKQNEQITLNDEDVRAIQDAVDNPQPPNDTLKDAQVRYQEFKDNEPDPMHFETVTLCRDWDGIDITKTTHKALFAGCKCQLIRKSGTFNIVDVNDFRFEIPCYFFEPETKKSEQPDPVNHPTHYTDGGIETIDFIEAKKLDYYTGNAVKYISRAGKKDPSKEVQDLEKAIWYLKRKVERLKTAQDGTSNG